MALIDDQATYYAGLLLAEYEGSPRAVATIKIYVKQALADMLASQLDQAFWLSQAVGPQLDILAKYIGIPRTIGLPVARNYFTFSDYLGPSLSTSGFIDYLNPATNAGVIWYDYLFFGTENTALSDTAFLFMLKMQIILNSNDGTLASIMELLQMFFAGQVRLVDNKNMTLTYYLGSQIPVPPPVLQPYLPKPMGVGVIFVNVNSVTIPSTIAATGASHIFPITVTTSPIVAVVSSGTPPYSYQWTLVSGSALVVPNTPNAVSTTFSYTRTGTPSPASVSAVYQVTATDSNGIPFLSNQISVTLTANRI